VYMPEVFIFFFFQAEDGIRDRNVTGVQTCALPIFHISINCNITNNRFILVIFFEIFSWVKCIHIIIVLYKLLPIRLILLTMIIIHFINYFFLTILIKFLSNVKIICWYISNC